MNQMNLLEALAGPWDRVYLKTPITVNGASYTPGYISKDYLNKFRGRHLDFMDLFESPTVMAASPLTNVNPFRVATRSELTAQEKEDLETEYRESMHRALQAQIGGAKPKCSHKWKTTMGIYREYKDCVLCEAKFEDVYPSNRVTY